MFGNIIVTFIRVVLLSFLLLVAFSLAFYMAFYRPGAEFFTSPFNNPAYTFLTVLTYSLGGADYNGLFGLSHEGEENLVQPPFLTISIIVWVLFLIGMLILLINMLVSWAFNCVISNCLNVKTSYCNVADLHTLFNVIIVSMSFG